MPDERKLWVPYDQRTLDTSSQPAWEASIKDAFLAFPGNTWPRMKRHYGVSQFSHDTITKLIGGRYPKIELSKLPKTIKELVGSLLIDDANLDSPGKYERTASHDRDPYDKDFGYDRQGFSRS